MSIELGSIEQTNQLILLSLKFGLNDAAISRHC